MSSHSVRVAGDEYLGEHHIYRPHRAGLPPLGQETRHELGQLAGLDSPPTVGKVRAALERLRKLFRCYSAVRTVHGEIELQQARICIYREADLNRPTICIVHIYIPPY